MPKTGYVLLDRDGTINVERHYLSDPDEVELLPSAAAGMRRMRELGLGLVIVTNQSGVGRGYFDEGRLAEIHARLLELLAAESVVVDAIYSCCDHPDHAGPQRKPNTGMIEDAVHDFGFDPSAAFVVGDKACDVQLGRNVDATTVLVRTGYGRQTEAAGECRPDHVVDDLLEMADVVENELANRLAPSSVAISRRDAA